VRKSVEEPAKVNRYNVNGSRQRLRGVPQTRYRPRCRRLLVVSLRETRIPPSPTARTIPRHPSRRTVSRSSRPSSTPAYTAKYTVSRRSHCDISPSTACGCARTWR
jgi:hypothetical protein